MKSNKKLKFNFVIGNRSHESKIIKTLKKHGFEKYFLFYGKGSANSILLDYLGIGETEKVVLVYPSNENDSKIIMNISKSDDYLKNTIVFRVPVAGISNKKSLDYFLKEVVDSE